MLGEGALIPNLPLKYTPQLVTHSNHHDFLARTGEGANLILDHFSNRSVDSTAKSTIRGHPNDEVLLLVLGGLDFCFLIESWKSK